MMQWMRYIDAFDRQVYDRLDFFDPVLYCPVSLRDRMVGSHSHGEAATHRFIQCFIASWYFFFNAEILML